MPLRDFGGDLMECYAPKRGWGRLCWNVMPIRDVWAIVFECYARKRRRGNCT
jgi:hypothetical protein